MVPAQFFHIMYNTSVFFQIFGKFMQFFHIMIPVHFSNFWKLHAGKFFGNYMLGNFLETIRW